MCTARDYTEAVSSRSDPSPARARPIRSQRAEAELALGAARVEGEAVAQVRAVQRRVRRPSPAARAPAESSASSGPGNGSVRCPVQRASTESGTASRAGHVVDAGAARVDRGLDRARDVLVRDQRADRVEARRARARPARPDSAGCR